LNLKTEQANAFFRLMDQRYGRVSTIITTNLDYPRWYEMFNNKPLVDALLDRLQHHCVTVRIEGPSLRSEPLNKEPIERVSERPNTPTKTIKSALSRTAKV
jgi:DNA replication protein DnaC